MNLLGLILGFLLIFACTFSLSLAKSSLSQRVEKTYQAHTNATRHILNSYESLCYHRMRGETKDLPKISSQKKPQKKKEEPSLNQECARINLWPLIEDGKEKHIVLYETAARALSAMYRPILAQIPPRSEYTILDAILSSAQKAKFSTQHPHVHLEKLSLNGDRVKQLYTLQSIYYQMLRGTKQNVNELSYPSLMECFVIDQKPSAICIQHASFEMLKALFGEKAAGQLFHEMEESEIPLTMERIQDVCHQASLDVSEDFFKLLDLQSRHHLCGPKILVGQDQDICIKQKVYLPS